MESKRLKELISARRDDPKSPRPLLVELAEGGGLNTEPEPEDRSVPVAAAAELLGAEGGFERGR